MISGFSEDAAQAYRKRFIAYIQTFGAEVDHPLCRFRRWCKLGYRCAVFEKHWVLAYEVTDEGVIVQDMSQHSHARRHCGVIRFSDGLSG